MSAAVDVFDIIRNRGIRLWLDSGQLRYQAAQGALTREDIELLRTSKAQIIEYLQAAKLHRAPLAFSQRAHWRMYRLDNRPAIRQVASATRLCGYLDIEALRMALIAVVQRHDALRTRIVRCDGALLQQVDQSSDCALVIVDLASLPKEQRRASITRHIDELILEPIDVSVGPLLGARLLRLGDAEHVLIVAMDHLVSDGYSLRLLMRDLFAAYVHAVTGDTLSWPPIGMQFPAYAACQNEFLPAWLEQHCAYWERRLSGCERLRFPEDRDPSSEPRHGWGTVPIRIDKDGQAQLRETCRKLHTTLAIGVFTAYVALVLRWCNTSESIIRYASDGRITSDIENTIGYFAATLLLRLELKEADSLAELAHRVIAEYCNAYEHADFSYIASRADSGEYTRNTAFNWLPQGAAGSELARLEGSPHALVSSPVEFGYPLLRDLEVDREPGILLYDTDDGIVGDLYFPLDRFSIGSMASFAGAFMTFVAIMRGRPETRVASIPLQRH